jgi:hypothetical protein
MRFSPINYRTRLYRKAVLGVILGAVLGAFLPAFAQYAKKRQVSKGPRALGLLELAQNGKAHLIPITIMVNGKFYDAGAYKASPVPMALQYETVYEAEKSGASQGLFTVAGALAQKDSWVADGKWRSQADIEAEKAKKKADAAKRAYKAPEEVGGPPKLRRAPTSEGDSSSGSATQKSPAPSASQAPSGNEGGASSSSSPSSQSSSKSGSTPTTRNESSSPSSMDAPDRPVLRHQAPTESTQEQTKSGNDVEPLQGPIQLLPAISDADGPDPRPYTYDMKPDDEQKFRQQMLAMAADEVNARAGRLGSESLPAKPRAKSAKGPEPEFQNVQLKVFDLTNSNEPVLVLTATASIPNSKLNLQYFVAVVAREDIYAELHKVTARITDNQHLDVLPKYEFIDAVDADGDGRGELLFRLTSDSGTAYDIYAVIGDRLWPLFEGRPGA